MICENMIGNIASHRTYANSQLAVVAGGESFRSTKLNNHDLAISSRGVAHCPEKKLRCKNSISRVYKSWRAHSLICHQEVPIGLPPDNSVQTLLWHPTSDGISKTVSLGRKEQRESLRDVLRRQEKLLRTLTACTHSEERHVCSPR
jgi:hypothetical protein